MPRFSATERIGVAAVAQITSAELGWIFREQLVADMGIDAQLEVVENQNPTGKLIAVQIKTGPSHFRKTRAGYVYYGENIHLDYWLGHSLPIILVAHLPASGETFWVLVNNESAQRTRRRWRILIPLRNRFGQASLPVLAKLAEGPPAQQRLKRLSLDEPLMRHIVSGGKVSLELQDWVNKSLGRTPVQVFIYDKNGKEILDREWFQYYVGLGVKDLAEKLFPWATASVDEEFYDEHEEISASDDWFGDEECQSVRRSGTIRPYSESFGEVEHFRLILTLNKLGFSFLEVTDYVSAENSSQVRSPRDKR